MIKKRIKYTDYNGLERDEVFYFNMSTVEATRLQASVAPEKIDEYILRIAREERVDLVLEMIEKIILSSYGIKSPNGKSFIKTEKATREFEYSQAYAILFEELLTDPNALSEFANGIGALVPTTMRTKKNAEGLPAEVEVVSNLEN